MVQVERSFPGRPLEGDGLGDARVGVREEHADGRTRARIRASATEVRTARLMCPDLRPVVKESHFLVVPRTIEDQLELDVYRAVQCELREGERHFVTKSDLAGGNRVRRNVAAGQICLAWV